MPNGKNAQKHAQRARRRARRSPPTPAQWKKAQDEKAQWKNLLKRGTNPVISQPKTDVDCYENALLPREIISRIVFWQGPWMAHYIDPSFNMSWFIYMVTMLRPDNINTLVWLCFNVFKNRQDFVYMKNITPLQWKKFGVTYGTKFYKSKFVLGMQEFYWICNFLDNHSRKYIQNTPNSSMNKEHVWGDILPALHFIHDKCVFNIKASSFVRMYNTINKVIEVNDKIRDMFKVSIYGMKICTLRNTKILPNYHVLVHILNRNTLFRMYIARRTRMVNAHEITRYINSYISWCMNNMRFHPVESNMITDPFAIDIRDLNTTHGPFVYRDIGMIFNHMSINRNNPAENPPIPQWLEDACVQFVTLQRNYIFSHTVNNYEEYLNNYRR